MVGWNVPMVLIHRILVFQLAQINTADAQTNVSIEKKFIFGSVSTVLHHEYHF
jgi:hypothetical protein